MLGPAHYVDGRPCPERIESVGAQHRLLRRGPGFGRREFLGKGLALTVRTAHREDRNTLGQIGIPLGIDQPPAVADLFGAEESRRLLPVDHPAAELILPGVGPAGIEARKTIDRLRFVTLPLRLPGILARLDLPVFGRFGREASHGQRREQEDSISFHDHHRRYL